MKKILFVLISFAIVHSLSAQHPSVEGFYKKYMSNEKVTNINLSGWVLKMAANFTDEETGERILNKITQLRVMVMEDGNLVTKSDYSKLIKDIQKDDFEQLMNVRDGSQKIDFYYQGTGDEVNNLLVLVNDTDQFVLLSLEGNLNFSDLNDLQIEVEGAEHFKKIPDNKKDIPRA